MTNELTKFREEIQKRREREHEQWWLKNNDKGDVVGGCGLLEGVIIGIVPVDMKNNQILSLSKKTFYR